MVDGVVTPPGSTTTGSRSRLIGLDVVRCVAIFGMMAVHVAASRLSTFDGPWLILQQAAGFAAGLFAVSAGVGLSLTNPVLGPDAPPGAARRALASTVLRGVVLFVLGLIVEPLSGPVLVILCTYGVLFVVAAPLRYLPGRALLALGVLLALLWPPLSLWIRRDLGPATLEVSWQVFTQPDALGRLVRILFIDGTYPVPTWLTLAVIAWGAHRCGWLQPRRLRALAVGGLGLGVLGFCGVAVAERLWHPSERQVDVLVAQGYSFEQAEQLVHHAFGVPPTTIWPALLTAGRHTGTTFELLQILCVATTVFVIATWAWQRGGWLSGLVRELSWPGRIPLTLYVAHLLVLGLSGWVWLNAADPGRASLWVVLALWFGSWLVARSLRGRRGPLEEFVHALSHPWPDDARTVGEQRIDRGGRSLDG